MSSDAPFFSESPYNCGPRGALGALEFRTYCRIEAFGDRLELDGVAIPYERVLRVASAGGVLEIAYLGSDGKTTERYFKLDKFLPGTGGKLLRALVERVGPLLPRRGSQPVVPCAEKLERSDDGRHWAKIGGSRAAFPAICPTCGRTAVRVAFLAPPNSLQGGAWLVPTCREHTGVHSAMKVDGWDPRVAELTFSFANMEYCEEFLRTNNRDPAALSRNASRAAEFEAEARAGTRLVVYQFAVSGIVVSILERSRIYVIAPGASRRWPAVPYILLTAVMGWWGIAGFFFTLRSLATNFRGGSDITAATLAVLQGQPVSGVGT